MLERIIAQRDRRSLPDGNCTGLPNGTGATGAITGDDDNDDGAIAGSAKNP